MIKTKEGGSAYEHSLNHALEYFSKAGSLFEKRGSFYDSEESALSLFQKTWIVDKELSFKLLLWLRDREQGAGNRSGARTIYRWLANNEDPRWIELNLENIIKLGRYDDLKSFFGTPLEKYVADIWAKRIKYLDVLAAKWADRKDIPLRNSLKMNEAQFRKLLANIRKNHIVEYKMCSREWEAIDYEQVPSVAMSRYTNAFKKNDKERFNEYKEGLKSGEKKVHASVLFPHDCVRTVLFGDREIGDAQFDALPNYLEDSKERIIVISDTSGSMNKLISGSVAAVHISQGIALYCSAKIPKSNPFHKKFIGFCSEGKFKDWNGMSFSEAVRDGNIFDHAIGSTRIDKALDLILKTAKFFNLTNDQMPTSLIIVSDMQFHEGCRTSKSKETYWRLSENNTEDVNSEVEIALNRWKENNYNIPKIVYWNTAGYVGSPSTANKTNICLVSGFSSAILKNIFSGDDLTPVGVMLRTLEKYNINVPK